MYNVLYRLADGGGETGLTPPNRLIPVNETKESVTDVNVTDAAHLQELLCASPVLDYGLQAPAQLFSLGKKQHGPRGVRVVPGTAYVFKVRALNEIGFGGWSSEVEGVTVPDVPDPVPTPACGLTRPLDLTLGWTAPYDNGAPVDGYQLSYAAAKTAGSISGNNSGVDAVEDEKTRAVVTTNRTSTKYRVGGSENWEAGSTVLKPLTEYYLKVRAHNRMGYGPWSRQKAACLTKSITLVGTDLTKFDTTHVSFKQCVACVPIVLDNPRSSTRPCENYAPALSTECRTVCDMLKEEHDEDEVLVSPLRNPYTWKNEPAKVKDKCNRLNELYASGGFGTVGDDGVSGTFTSKSGSAEIDDADSATLAMHQMGPKLSCPCGPMKARVDKSDPHCSCILSSKIFR